MHRGVFVAALVGAGAGLLWAGLSAQQEMRPTPGPGSGIMKVTGTVDVGNAPQVHAAQQGEWRIAVANRPDVRVVNTPEVIIPSPDFLKKGGRHTITWTTGQQEAVQIHEVGAGGWMQVTTSTPGSVPGLRWINLAAVRSIEDAPK
jgi:hypothetical protein